jgi:hypothetical protein
MDGALSAVEHGHKPVAGRRDFAAPKSVEHGPHRLVVPGQQVAPRAVAELEGTGGGVHDVSYQERRQHSVEATALRTRETPYSAASRS